MRISNLSNKSGNPSSSDYLVLDDGTTVTKIDYNKLAKAIIENYAASTLAGSAQSVKAALDSLNSNSMAAKALLTSADDLNQLTTGVYTWNTSRPQNLPDSQDHGLIVVFEGNIGGVFYNFQLCSLPGRALFYRRKKGNSADAFAAWARVAIV